ncbi:hypothetical protein MMC28_006774 [Mycoblastus sanguinarius]|nr:hypothetical protein [Mycoblastus sanguinarius]
MAAGIGEASAILAVAQIGISLSNTLIAYISEVKDAPSRIERIGNEIHTTSERLKDIGELVDTNKQTHIISQEGIHSAVRCSRECCKIIDDVKEILCKAGWQQRPKEKDEIDTSLFSTLRCPSSEQSLSSTAAEKQSFMQDIPGLEKTRAWAAQMAEDVRQRAQDRVHNPSLPARIQRRIREEEEQRIKERAALIRAGEEEKKRLEDQAQRDVERKAVERYKQEQEELRIRLPKRRIALGKNCRALALKMNRFKRSWRAPTLGFMEQAVLSLSLMSRQAFHQGTLPTTATLRKAKQIPRKKDPDQQQVADRDANFQGEWFLLPMIPL